MSDRPAVLVVDDDEDLLELLTIRLEGAGFSVTTANSGQAALTVLARVHPRVVVTDLLMDDMDGLGLLKEIEARHPLLPVILLTAHGTIPDAVAATRGGAFAFLTKPLNAEELIATIKAAIGGNRDPAAASNSMASDNEWRTEILTRSPVMEALLDQARLAAASDANIIIESASGTGKELLARAIHKASRRAGAEFVAVNCSAIPEALFESEMFGHVKGSFTGAQQNRLGLFKRAHGGTLFLDEIGDMPLAFQAKLLRTLQERTIRAVGSDDAVPIDVRIVAATHRDLEAACRANEFREDLYYRLNVITLSLPELAERREDIPLLANHFLKQFATDGMAKGFAPAAMEHLIGADWPGNIRQLANVVQQCVVLSRSELVTVGLVERALRRKTRGLVPFATAREQFEYGYLVNLLQATDGNVSQAARLAERNRSEFYQLLKKHGLDPAAFRGAATEDDR